jgi:NhaP-type Na+/H+ or K+/H+ antiporter
MPDLLSAFTLIAIVLIVSALASGLIERAPVSFPMIFLGIGFLLGDRGLGFLHIGPHNMTLEVIAILSLSFVLALDAVSLRFDELGKGWIVPTLSVGPGTLLTVTLIAFAAGLLRTSLLQSLLLGAILSSMDPVVLRDVVRDERVPRSIRQALTVEAGTNDIVVLPIILILATIAQSQVQGASGWILLITELFVLGPAAGIAVGLLAVWLIRQVRARTSISRIYRALYGVGAMLAAYVVGESVGGSGFLAVFAAGAVTVALDYDLCGCFLEYSEITFVLFGALLSTLIETILLLPSLIFAVLVIFLARPLGISLVLLRAHISQRARLFIGYVRGLEAELGYFSLAELQQIRGRSRATSW